MTKVSQRRFLTGAADESGGPSLPVSPEQRQMSRPLSLVRLAGICSPALALICGAAYFPAAAQTQSLEGLSWGAQKCVLYESAVIDALQMLGRSGIRDEFLARNAEFIENGCVANDTICPETAREIDLVNLLTVMTMNEGMASTFVPFDCAD